MASFIYGVLVKNTVNTFSKEVSPLTKSISSISEKDILNYIIENSILDLDGVQAEMTNKKRDKILSQHPYKIYQEKSSGRWRTYIPDSTKPSNRKPLVKTSKENLENCIIECYLSQDEAEKLKQLTLETLYFEWLEYKRNHTTAETYITRINSDWKKYYANTEIIKIPVVELTKLELDNWVHRLIKQYNMTKNQYYNMAVIMRQALDYAVDKGIIEINPLSLVKIDGKRLFRKVKKKPDETQVFLQDELTQLTEMAWSDFYNRTKLYELAPLAVLFQFQTGVRIGEVCVLQYDDIETADYIHVQRMWRRQTREVVEHTKTEYGDRNVFLTASAKEIIAVAKKRQVELGVENDGYIFSINGLPLGYRSVSNLYVKYSDKLGTVRKSSHKARKTYISALIDGQVNINTVRELVGHADERTTFGNYCFDRRTQAEKISMIEKALG